MMKIILRHGFIAGVILSVVLVTTQPLFRNGTLDFDSGPYVGIPATVIGLSMVFFGIRMFRDKHLNGYITIGKAFGIGILIVLLAAVIHGITWEVYHNLVATDFVEWLQKSQLDKMVKEGATEEELSKAREEMARFAEQYKNPLIRFVFTLTEIIPIGLIVTLVSASLLRRKENLSLNK